MSSEQSVPKLVDFIRHLPQMSFQEKEEIEKLNPLLRMSLVKKTKSRNL